MRSASRSPTQAHSAGTPRDDPAVADLRRSSERWLGWLAGELARERRPPGSYLLVLWDVLEGWFASDDFAGSTLAAAVAAPPDGRAPAVNAVLVQHRQALRQLLEDLARASSARDPTALAAQLLILIEGAIVGAVVDRHPRVARQARELTEVALGRAARGEGRDRTRRGDGPDPARGARPKRP